MNGLRCKSVKLSGCLRHFKVQISTSQFIVKIVSKKKATLESSFGIHILVDFIFTQ